MHVGVRSRWGQGGPAAAVGRVASAIGAGFSIAVDEDAGEQDRMAPRGLFSPSVVLVAPPCFITRDGASGVLRSAVGEGRMALSEMRRDGT